MHRKTTSSKSQDPPHGHSFEAKTMLEYHAQKNAPTRGRGTPSISIKQTYLFNHFFGTIGFEYNLTSYIINLNVLSWNNIAANNFLW